MKYKKQSDTERKTKLLTDCCRADFLRRETFRKTNEVGDYCLKCGNLTTLSVYTQGEDGEWKRVVVE